MTAVMDRPAAWRAWSPGEKRRLRRRLWREVARVEQLPPPGDWRVWYLQGGRGSGKTRAAAEAFAPMITDSDVGEWGVIAPTYGDGRDVCIEGPSGLLAALGLPRSYGGWNRSMGELRLDDGSTVYVDGADDGALRIQGRNLRGAWCDEIGLWRRWEIAWTESISFAVRLEPAQIICSGTPKRGHGLVRRLADDPTIPVSRLRTVDNLANLSDAAVADLEARYAGTRLGRQELEGELLTDVEGALWQLATIDAHRVGDFPDLTRCVVAVDPAVTSGDDADDTGIIVAGRAGDHAYVLEDASVHADPVRAMSTAIDAYHALSADVLVVERNNGGDYLPALVASIDPGVHVETVVATRGKQTRAQPVAGLYEQGRVHHVGGLVHLEDQLTTWTPEDADSPDRLDALVWAVTALFPELSTARRRLRA